jgi:hypothetical protein
VYSKYKKCTRITVCTTANTVLTKFEDGKERYKDNSILAGMFNSGWSKLDKYYQLTDESPAYTAAIVLHPRMKWLYIDKNWDLEWRVSARQLVTYLWQEYRPISLPDRQDNSNPSSMNEFLQWKASIGRPSIVDEYEQYCLDDVVCSCQNALDWWLQES